MTKNLKKPVRRRKPRASAVIKRRVILDAALTVFSNEGYEGTTTRAIALEAGLQVGHLAKYFATKEALWRSVIEEFNGEIDRILDETMSHADASPLSAARALLRPFLRFFAVNHRLTRLMLQEFSVSSPRHDWVVEQVGMPVWRRLKPLFEVMHARKKHKKRDAAFGYFALLGSVLVFFGASPEVRAIAGLDPGDEATIDQYIDFLIGPMVEL